MMDIVYGLSDNTWDQNELMAVNKVISSGNYSMGQITKDYEKKFAAKFGSKYAVMSNSGSSANLLMIAALVYSGRLHKEDEVLVTAVSWSTTYFPLAQFGLKVRFVDIDIDSLNADTERFESAVTQKTKAVLAVNLLGNPNDFERLCSFCEMRHLILLEDNCESLGAVYKGKKCGTFGLAGTFSTYFSHHLCTMEGGITLTDDEELYQYMLAVRSHGWTRHLPEQSSIYTRKEEKFYESFHFIVPGFNLRPLEIEAAAGLEQLDKMERVIMQRRDNARYFKKVIQNRTDFLIQKECGESSWFGFALILPQKYKGNRQKYITALLEEGIETRPIVAGNFTKQEAVKYMDYSISGSLKNADYIHNNAFFVGNHSVPIYDKIDLLAEVLIK